MKRITLVVLDMAGTTVNEHNVVYKTLQKVINEQGFDVSLDDVLEHGGGKEKFQAIKDVLEHCTDAQDNAAIAQTAFSNFKGKLKKAYDALEVTPFAGVELLIADLRQNNIKVVLNTGYDRKTAESLMQKLNWGVDATVDALITADDVNHGRPSPDMIVRAMDMFGVDDPAMVLKAGDSLIDIEEGNNGHCGITVGVLSGAQTREQLAKGNPTYILENLTQLRKILL